MTETMTLKLNQLLDDAQFNQEVSTAETWEDMQDVLHKNGVDLSEDDIAYCIQNAEIAMKETGFLTEDGELTEQSLELVSGGKGGGFVVFGGVWVALGIAYKVLGTAAICATIGSGCIVIGAVLIVGGLACMGVSWLKKHGYI